MRDTSFFSQIIQNEFEAGGFHYCNPTFYYDTTSIQVIFLAPIDKVKALLPSARMHLLPITPLSTLVVFTALNYRDTDIGPYNEVSIGFPVTLDKPMIPLLGVPSFMHEPIIYIWQLPVTTEIARYGGVEFYNFPKFIADIDFKEQDDHLQCRVAEGGHEIFSMKIHKIQGSGSVRWRTNLLSMRNDSILRTQTVQMDKGVSHDSRKAEIAFTLGDHPIAIILKQLPLGRIMNYSYTPQSQMILPGVIESYPAH